MALNTSRDELSKVEASLAEEEVSSKSESNKITVGTSCTFRSVESTTWAYIPVISSVATINSRNFFILNLL